MYSTAVRTQKHQLKNYIFFFGFLSVNKQDSEAKHFKLTSDVINEIFSTMGRCQCARKVWK